MIRFDQLEAGMATRRNNDENIENTPQQKEHIDKIRLEHSLVRDANWFCSKSCPVYISRFVRQSYIVKPLADALNSQVKRQRQHPRGGAGHSLD